MIKSYIRYFFRHEDDVSFIVKVLDDIGLVFELGQSVVSAEILDSNVQLIIKSYASIRDCCDLNVDIFMSTVIDDSSNIFPVSFGTLEAIRSLKCEVLFSYTVIYD